MILYIGMLIFSGLIIWGILFNLSNFISKKVINIDLRNKAKTHSLHSATLVLVLMLFSLPISYWGLNYFFDYSPPFHKDNTEKIMNQELYNMRIEAERIEQTLSNIENLPLNEIKKEVNLTLKFVDELEKEAKKKHKRFIEFEKKLEKIKLQTKSARTLRDSQLLVTAEYFSELTNKERDKNKNKEWLNGLLTGVVSSIIASLILIFFNRLRLRKSDKSN